MNLYSKIIIFRYAQMTKEEKNTVSHRYFAAEELIKHFKSNPDA